MWSRSILIFIVGLFFIGFATVVPVFAQLTPVECGSIVTGEFTGNDQVHLYEIRLNAGDTITVSGSALDNSLMFNILLYGPSGILIEASDQYLYSSQAHPEVSTPSLRTRTLSASGIYTLRAVNGYFYGYSATVNEDGQDDPVGSYQLQVSCVLQNGTQVTAGTPIPFTPVEPTVVVTLPIIRNQAITPLNCGQLMAGEFRQFSEIQRYSVDIASDDQAFWVSVTSAGDYLRTALSVINPSSEGFLWEYGAIGSSPSLELSGPFRSGVYTVNVSNSALNQFYPSQQVEPNSPDLSYNGGVGQYVVGVGCRLADGTTINPGDVVTEEQVSASATQAPVATDVPVLVTSCPNSPAPRLSIGLQGQVTPGDPNNVRSEPIGATVVGQIPGGEEFTVLEGPVCGLNGLTFWRVQYGELNGWTAEGQGTEYWLEPIQSGRG